ncbi:GL12108 [Drosophila persimilis]|uniref:GL12108 n=1 Tax=Drosophila persimilis TaxID=7234 RepID=B4GL44_DROPE|nr:GL12108 [Drosophila persimilis]
MSNNININSMLRPSLDSEEEEEDDIGQMSVGSSSSSGASSNRSSSSSSSSAPGSLPEDDVDVEDEDISRSGCDHRIRDGGRHHHLPIGMNWSWRS